MKPRIVPLILVPLAILLLPLTVYWIDRAAGADEVPRNVSVAGIQLGGLSREDALLALRAHEAQLTETPAVFVVNGNRYQLDPRRVGLSIDEERLVDAAMEQRRTEGVLSGLREWLRSFTSPVELDLAAEVDEEAIDDHLDVWESDAIPNPASPGAVTVVEGQVVAEYPRAGEALDHEQSKVIVATTLVQTERSDTELPVVEAIPGLSDADIDDAVEEVERIIDDEVTLRSVETGFLITFEPAQLAEAVVVTVSNEPPLIEVNLDSDYVNGLLNPRREEFEIPPVDAAYNIDLETDEIEIVPGRSGTKLDLPGVVASLHAAALGSGFGPFPVLEGDEPAFTTEAAEAFFADIELVSEFTTKHPCCQNRVVNIHLMADAVDGAIVLPGNEFSLNQHVGQRTVEKGYLEDCAIVGGEVVCEGTAANVGGGVSQFATTFYNAVFFGCYEDVAHQPHSLYFSRYPEGREATLGWMTPDVVFRNDSETPVIIKTHYTDREITVKFYGNNGGKECLAETSERTNIEEWEEVLVADEPEEGEEPLKPGERKTVQEGRDGFTVEVTRIIRMRDGTVIREEPFRWRYRKLDKQVAVHACEITGEPVNCPAPVPSVVGDLYEEALTELTERGFVVVRINEEVDDPDRDGLVLAMDPPAGEYLAPGASVRLTVGVYSGDPGEGDGGDG